MVKKGYLEKAGCRLEHETEGKQGVERTPEKGFQSQSQGTKKLLTEGKQAFWCSGKQKLLRVESGTATPAPIHQPYVCLFKCAHVPSLLSLKSDD